LSRCVLQAGDSPLQLGPKAEESGKVRGNPLSFLLRLLLGSAAGFYYFLVSEGREPADTFAVGHYFALFQPSPEGLW
jgi:hypothetical protein